MPPKKLQPRTSQQPPQTLVPQQKTRTQTPHQKQQSQTPQPKQQSQSAPKPKANNASSTPADKPAIPEHELKQNSSMSAQLALEAAKKAYELRQAAYGAGDPNAREEILAKAINKEIEAESFGKAAKYTRSGAFQGLAAGAGLGVQPGVTLGKLTGALVGGVVSSAGALLGGGVGSAYGAISGPFWDLGQMASQGVRSIVGDFPNWEATSSQKKELEKMVMGTQQTKAPSEEELQEMRDDDGGRGQQDYQRWTKDLTSYIPRFGGQSKGNNATPVGNKSHTLTANQNQQPNTTTSHQSQQPKAPAKSKTATASNKSQQTTAPAKPQTASQPPAAPKPQAAPPRAPSQRLSSQPSPKTDETAQRRKPKKLETRSTGPTSQSSLPATRRPPPKLETRSKPTTAKA
ncbi:hypothetical protein LTR20_006724 [Exophiala xenobiotica]|nr:hypothetical protein LTR90_007288 [Exophiala xenobiotica]KAK5461800.1 hypothetical protein LTR20_006724 [Exophiala xenobiotica]KAK5482484.1 hypothetical protein LTR26_006818 [Exophiala xenobiotica]KAK5507191.1 hypothetical protein LTR21_009402 [Exophiala xenobiotica]